MENHKPWTLTIRQSNDIRQDRRTIVGVWLNKKPELSVEELVFCESLVNDSPAERQRAFDASADFANAFRAGQKATDPEQDIRIIMHSPNEAPGLVSVPDNPFIKEIQVFPMITDADGSSRLINSTDRTDERAEFYDVALYVRDAETMDHLEDHPDYQEHENLTFEEASRISAELQAKHPDAGFEWLEEAEARTAAAEAEARHDEAELRAGMRIGGRSEEEIERAIVEWRAAKSTAPGDDVSAIESVTKSDKVVITHPEMGIYLGNALGLGFWSKLDSAGQSEAVVFNDAAAAKAHVSSWEENNDPDGYDYVTVDVDGPYADIRALTDAKLGPLLGGLVFETARQDLMSHRDAWRKALELAEQASPLPSHDQNDQGYWLHERNAFDRTFEQVTSLSSNEPVSDDIDTHRSAWRRALELAEKAAPGEGDRSYWAHELQVFDRTFDALNTAPTIESQGHAYAYTENWKQKRTGDNDDMLKERGVIIQTAGGFYPGVEGEWTTVDRETGDVASGQYLNYPSEMAAFATAEEARQYLDIFQTGDRPALEEALAQRDAAAEAELRAGMRIGGRSEEEIEQAILEWRQEAAASDATPDQAATEMDSDEISLATAKRAAIEFVGGKIDQLTASLSDRDSASYISEDSYVTRNKANADRQFYHKMREQLDRLEPGGTLDLSRTATDYGFDAFDAYADRMSGLDYVSEIERSEGEHEEHIQSVLPLLEGLRKVGIMVDTTFRVVDPPDHEDMIDPDEDEAEVETEMDSGPEPQKSAMDRLTEDIKRALEMATYIVTDPSAKKMYLDPVTSFALENEGVGYQREITIFMPYGGLTAAANEYHRSSIYIRARQLMDKGFQDADIPESKWDFDNAGEAEVEGAFTGYEVSDVESDDGSALVVHFRELERGMEFPEIVEKPLSDLGAIHTAPLLTTKGIIQHATRNMNAMSLNNDYMAATYMAIDRQYSGAAQGFGMWERYEPMQKSGLVSGWKRDIETPQGMAAFLKTDPLASAELRMAIEHIYELSAPADVARVFKSVETYADEHMTPLYREYKKAAQQVSAPRDASSPSYSSGMGMG